VSTHPAVHPAALPIERLLADCRVERLRRSGPGGQHRNKVETAVRLLHVPTGVTGEASERRSQEENRRMAVARLRVNLALECRGGAAGASSAGATSAGATSAGATSARALSAGALSAGESELPGPSVLWRRRCHGGRIAVSVAHDDFPALLAEALDAIAACDDDPAAAASRLTVTPSQLVKLLKREPRALATVNTARTARGLRPLR
jgi:hypothetical protein